MRIIFFICLITTFFSCGENKDNKGTVPSPVTSTVNDTLKSTPVADATTIYARKQIPILCYHHIRETKPGDYVVSPSAFAEQMQALADSGYTTILPGQLYDYLAKGIALPEKSVMLSFDDTDLEQFTIGKTEMSKHHFKGIFFIMNISIGKPRYMNKEQLKLLADSGNAVQAHTWDHHRVTEYTSADWDKQLTDAKQKLESITGQPIDYFAYPFGLWNKEAIPELQKRGIKMAFQLSSKRDSTQPLYTVRRMLVPGTWTTKGLFKAMKSTFGL